MQSGLHRRFAFQRRPRRPSRGATLEPFGAFLAATLPIAQIPPTSPIPQTRHVNRPSDLDHTLTTPRREFADTRRHRTSPEIIKIAAQGPCTSWCTLGAATNGVFSQGG